MAIFRSMQTFTTADFSAMKQHFASGKLFLFENRINQLQLLKQSIQQFEPEILDALYKDLRKSKEEAYTTEIGFLYAEINHTLKHLKKWMQPQNVGTPFFLFPSKSKIIRDPLGVVLIVAPWNYPFQLLIAPLIGAIAGGNCAVLKPSELTPHTSEVVSKMIASYFHPSHITVVQGDGAIVVPQLLYDNHFDHVFFTGSIAVGKVIAKLAAEKLTPTTLELGGKSPCIVEEDADIVIAAKRIVWGKFTNAGQTCVAPDYILVHEKKKDALIAAMKKAIRQFYGNDAQLSADYGRIINKRRFDKLKGFIEQGNVEEGGKSDEQDLYISPTILTKTSFESPIMQEEIFGPILPVITFNQTDTALSIVAKNPNPLALYYFGKKNEERYMNEVSFGGGCINNTLVHLGNTALPFGGVGNSGMGVYHGKYSFDTFTRPKSILQTANWLDPSIKYPPYAGKLKYIKWFLR